VLNSETIARVSEKHMTTRWFARRHRIGLWAAVAATLVIASPASAADDGMVRIGGTGMALAAVRLAGASLAAVEPGIQVTVLPSLGTPGGLKALAENAIDVAVTGRPLKNDEKAKGAVEAGCTTTPLVFASSHSSPNGVASADIPGFFSNTQPTWRDGKPLKVILRSRAGSENDYLKAAIPGMAPALDAAYRRPDIPVATTDQENAEHASRIDGSFAVMTMLQISGEKLNLRAVALDGVVPSAATLADKSYPMSATVCLVLPATPTAAANRFVAYLKSESGQALLKSLGATPLK
jgi:phosphate transport system substrate-binding protein